jgi:hypothetical protein
VLVAGNVVKRGGQLVGVDLDRTFGRLEASRNEILSKGGLLPKWAGEPAEAV